MVGSATFVDFRLVVPRRMAVEDAHAISDRIEGALREQAGATSISIHVEPEGKAKHHGVVVLQRRAPFLLDGSGGDRSKAISPSRECVPQFSRVPQWLATFMGCQNSQVVHLSHWSHDNRRYALD